jgi:hypothetical protein
MMMGVAALALPVSSMKRYPTAQEMVATRDMMTSSDLLPGWDSGGCLVVFPIRPGEDFSRHEPMVSKDGVFCGWAPPRI